MMQADRQGGITDRPFFYTRTRTSQMLVLSRKRSDQIRINDDIVLTVVEIRGDKVRLGIEAPPDVPVHRQEVYDAIHGNEEEQA